MQKYLQPNEENMSQEDCQLIFRLRSRVTKVKTNTRGMYETYECDACETEEETQEHVSQCKKLTNMNIELNYEKIFNGSI